MAEISVLGSVASPRRSDPPRRSLAPGARPARDRRYGTQRWRRVSRRVLDRDFRVCLVVPDCPTTATMADHIIPVHPGMGDDLFFGLGNLRAACRFHNSARGVAARLERETTSSSGPSTIVTTDYSR